jgi:hypothetical protein
MLLDPQTLYLVLHDQLDSQARSVRLSKTLTAAVSNWTPGSRLSPIWRIKGFDGKQAAFVGKQTLFFFGPIQPAELFANVQGIAEASSAGVWLTAGCFNVVLRLAESEVELRAAVLEWIQGRKIAYELWHLDDGVIISNDRWTHPVGSAQSSLDQLVSRLDRNVTPVLRQTSQENVIVTASCLARAAAVYPPIFDKLRLVAEATCLTVDAYERQELGVLELQSRLLSMNAALSRFSSQAFSGIPPILGTECHFWIHSLLGTGSANIALSNLVDTIQQTIGDARLPERLAALETKTKNVPNKERLVSDANLLNFDIIQVTEGDPISVAPIIPLITYFSGRDGFSSHLQTLSAPLTSLAECNSFRSNLLTVTHEISHILIQSALAVLSPSLDDKSEMDVARSIAKPGFIASNHLESARQLLVEAVISMEFAKVEFPANLVDKKLPELFERWRTEIQEILVHTFDFLYFHQSDPKFYVTSIWHSWCSIPGISDRVPEYLMRTLCAISATLLTTNSAALFQASVASTKELLADIHPNIDSNSNYVEQAMNLLNRLDGDTQIYTQMEKDFSARLNLVRLVKIYLFSERLAAKLFDDPFTRSGSAVAEKKKLTYNTSPLGNALIFLKNQLLENPSEAESLWVLHSLAFDLKPGPGAKT